MVLLGEILAPWRTEPDAPPGLAPRRLRSPIGAAIPEYPAILRAPVFRADRARGESASGRGAGAAAAASDTLQLLGVGGAPGSGTAVVKTADGATHGLRTGHGVQGWRLIAVDPAGATLAGPAGRIRLAVGAQAGGAPPPARKPEARKPEAWKTDAQKTDARKTESPS